MTEYATEIAAVLAVISTLIAQCLFYKKDSQTMSEIKQDVTEGNNRLSDRLDGKEQKLSAEHSDIHNLVKEISVKQEMELRMQEKIKDTIPDAGMIKEGIDKICRDNVKLREEVKDLKNQVEKLQEKNVKLEKSNRKLLKEIEQEKDHSDDFER